MKIFLRIEEKCLNFAIEYLREHEKVLETVSFSCSFGAKVKSFRLKNLRKSRDIVHLSLPAVEEDESGALPLIFCLNNFLISFSI